MKPLKALITKKNISSAKTSWPNPYNIEEKDQVGHLKNTPIEIINLMVHEYINQRKDREIRDALHDIQHINIDCLFEWEPSKEGWEFWADISEGKYDIFYQLYDKVSLSKRLGGKW